MELDTQLTVPRSSILLFVMVKMRVEPWGIYCAYIDWFAILQQDITEPRGGRNIIAYWLFYISWGLWCQKQISQAGIGNCIPQYCVGCNYLSIPEIPASGTKVLYYHMCLLCTIQKLHVSVIFFSLATRLIEIWFLLQTKCQQSDYDKILHVITLFFHGLCKNLLWSDDKV